MDTKKILIGLGVVGVAIFIFTKMRKKKADIAEPKVEPQKTLLTSEQVDKAIKEEPKKAQEVKATKEVKPEAPMPPMIPKEMMPKEEKAPIQNQKLPPPITETKLVGNVKPKVVLEFESSTIKNIYQAPPRFLNPQVQSAIRTSLQQQIAQQGVQLLPTQVAIRNAIQQQVQAIPSRPTTREVIASTPLTKSAPIMMPKIVRGEMV